MRLIALLAMLALSGCMKATSNVYSATVDPVTRTSIVTSNSVTFKQDAGIFGIAPIGFYLQGRIINNSDYLLVTYSNRSWLFMEQASFRFEDSERVYRISLTDVSRIVNYDASVTEWKVVPASSGSAKALVDEIVRRSKLPNRSRLLVRVDGADFYITGYDDMAVGYPSLGSFFAEQGEPN